MVNLYPTLTIQIIVPFLVGLVNIYLYTIYKKRYLKLWAFSWFAYALRNYIHTYMDSLGELSLFQLVYQGLALTSGFLLLWGNQLFVNKKISRMSISIILGVFVWVIIAVLIRLPFITFSIPVMGTLAAICIYTASIFVRFLEVEGIGKYIVGWTYVALAFHRGFYPFTRPIPWFAPYGYAISATLGLIIGFGMLILYFQITRKELEESENRYRSLFEESRDAIYISTVDGQFIDANQAWLDLFGYTRDELNKINAALTYPTVEARTNFKKEIEAAGSTHDYEVRLHRKDGTEMDCLITATVRKSRYGGEVIGYQGIIRDVTEHKQSERIKLLGTIAAGVAHEVRNPLNALISVAEALGKELGDKQEYSIFLTHIRTQVKRLSILMRDLLELGKPLDKKHFERESLHSICRAAIDAWIHLELSKRRHIVFEPPIVDELFVKTDPHKLQQAFLNLLDNAAANSPDNSTISLTIVHEQKGEVKVRIADQGTGIKEKDLSHVFEPFFSARQGGTGLGLSIVDHIVKAHGGTVTIYNNPDIGCTAEIHLPLARD